MIIILRFVGLVALCISVTMPVWAKPKAEAGSDQKGPVTTKITGSALLQDLRTFIRDNPRENPSYLISQTTEALNSGAFRRQKERHEAKGYLSFLNRDYERSAKHLKKAAQLDPEDSALKHLALNAEKQAGFARSKQNAEIRNMYQSQNWDLTIQLAEEALLQERNNIEAALYRSSAIKHQVNAGIKTAHKAIDESRFVDAYIHLRKAQELEPENQTLKNYLQRIEMALERKGELDKVISDAPATTQIDWGQSVGLYMDGLKSYSVGDRKKAASLWNEALKHVGYETSLYQFIKTDLGELASKDARQEALNYLE